MSPPETATIEARIATLASRQHGVVTRSQLLEQGLTSDTVAGRVRSRQLRPLHRGVYLLGTLVGPLEPPRAREMAAVLACGPGTMVSHESAACLWQLLSRGRSRVPVDVTIPGADRGRRPGIRPHRVANLSAEDRSAVDGVPTTAPARTVVDLAARVRPRVLEQALAELERRGLATLEEVRAALDRRPRARGGPLLRRLLRSRDQPAFTRSTAEERFLTLTRKGHLPTPETNVHVDGMEVDFLWRAEGVVVEVDGFAYHGSRHTFENDRRRDSRLAAEGFRVIRVTWRQLTDEPYAVLSRLAQVLTQARVQK